MSAVPRYPQPKLVWLAQAPDLLDLVSSERLQLTAELERWLEQLPGPVRVLVCSRRRAGPEKSVPRQGSSAGAQLGRMLQEHLREAQLRAPSFRRQVFVALAAPTADGESQLPPSPTIQLSAATGPVPLAEGPWWERPRLLRVGGRWLCSLWLERLPGVEVVPGWLWTLIGLPAEFDMALEVRPRASGSADRNLRRRMRGLRARELAAGERGETRDPRLEAALASASRLREVLARSEGKAFEVRLTITVAADSASGARRLASELRSRMTALRGSLALAWCHQAPARIWTLLGEVEAGGPGRVVHSAELASFWPWLDASPEAGEGAVHLGRHLRSGSPVWLNLHDPRTLPNANLGVVAASGSGKSYLGGLLGLEAVRLGVRTVVLDPENEHRRWCQAVGGSYLSLGEAAPTGFNILQMAERGEAPGAVAELVSLLCGHLSPAELGQVAEAVRWTLSQAGSAVAVLSDCLPRLRQSEAGEGVAHRLLPWLDGTPGALFNSPGQGPAVETAAGVGLRELPAAWVPAATLLVSHWLWAWIRTQPGRKQAIVDEAGLLADNDPLQRLMAHLARRIRKYQGSLVLLTQSAGDLLGSAPGEVMAVNSATMLLGSQHPAAARRLQQGFLLDDAQREWLERAGRGQFLLLLGARRSPIQVQAPDGYHRWLSTEGPEEHAEEGPAGRGCSEGLP